MFLLTRVGLLASCLLIVNSEISSAILAGSSNSVSNTTERQQAGDRASQDTKPEATGDAAINTTFYYDPNAFLINKQQVAVSVNRSESAQDFKPNDEEPRKKVKPATAAQTSGRNGRMLDLDALMGDFAAAQANKERSAAVSGNRQSRYLSGSTLDVGGKRLHIQGFIPIVGVKDVAQEAGNANQDSNSELLQPDIPQRQRAPQQQSINELPYEHSSIGHASFGVQRYLNGGELQTSAASQQQQQVDAKFSGSAVMDSLKRPLRKLTSGDEGGQQSNSVQQRQNCLCVPFYMCKNGYISESSLGKSQIQQMILNQQQQQQQQYPPNTPNEHQLEMKSGQSINLGGQRNNPVEQPPVQDTNVYADSYVPVDERSLNREKPDGSEMAGDLVKQQEEANRTELSTGDSQASNLDSSQPEPGQSTSTGDESLLNSTDYSQDILGRMLGLKSMPSRSGALSTSGGVCGLLRSCCNIPIHLIPSQQDLLNERLVAQQYGNSLQMMNKYNNQRLQASNKHVTVYSPSSQAGDQQMMSQQSQNQYHQQLAPMSNPYQQQQVLNNFQQKAIPYGLPSTQLARVQPTNNPFGQAVQDTSSLAHRSNQFQLANRYQVAPPQVAQYNRAASPMQALQSFQQPQTAVGGHQQAKSMPVPLAGAGSVQQHQQLSSQQNLANLALRNQPPGSGTRKILDGRCGLRQSAGITGRVQNLQYHESSADFGEYPGQAAILKRLSGSESLFVCGGTLISQYWVATAAHCIKKHAQSDLKVRLGEWDVHRDDEFYPFVEKEVRDLVVHPEFVSGNLVNDIALLRLDSPVDTNLPHVNPACLPSVDESFARQRCWVTGWGKDSFGQKGSFQAVLREVELPVIGQTECESALRQTRLGPHYRLHQGFICAGGEGGKDACEGDGGSGLYCLQEGVIKVAGLVSWGIGCGQAGVPGVYVSMAHYRTWIENIISIDEDIYSPYMNLIGNSLISERSNANSSSSNGESVTAPTTQTSAPGAN